MGGTCCRALFFFAILWLIDWLIQDAAKDLVNAEEDVMGDDRREEDGVGEEGTPALTNEDLPEAVVGVGEEAGGAPREETMPAEGVGDEQEKALETEFGEVKPSNDPGVREDAGTTLNGDEQGGRRGEEAG